MTDEEAIKQLSMIIATQGRIFETQSGVTCKALFHAMHALEGKPKGKWKHHNSYYKRCDQCNKIVGFDYILQDGETFNFCPNCGARMEI